MNRSILSVTLTAFLAVAPVAAYSQQEGPVPTQVLVSIESKSGFTPTTADLTAEVNGKPSPVSSVAPLPPSQTQVALLIDEGLRSSFGVQLDDVKKWLVGLRPGTQVFVGYMQNGRVVPVQNFTTDYAAAAGKVRLPMSFSGANGSPYFSLSDFVKNWPTSNEPGLPGQPAPAPNLGYARFVLMITNGVDRYNGSVSPLNQDSPYVTNSATDALRAGVPVYSIYYADRDARGRFASFSGQSYLNQVAEATGGRSFYQGTFTPVSLLPFFKQFDQAVAQTYIVTVTAIARRKDEQVRFKLSANQKGVKFYAPSTVRPGVTALTNSSTP